MDKTPKEIPLSYRDRFGMIAVFKKFITVDQLKKALAEQIDDNVSSKQHRLIGEILLDKGLMSSEQINEVLKVMKHISQFEE